MSVARPAQLVVLASLLVSLAASASAGGPVRLCLLPLTLPFEAGDPRGAMLEEKLAQHFEEGDFVVVRSSDTRPLVEANDERWGRIFDPALGTVIQDALATRNRKLGRALSDEHGCQAWISAGVRVLLATYVGGDAKWDGVVVPINSPVRSLFVGAERGWVSALSLWIELFDLAGESLSFRSAGIEPLIHFSLTRSVDRLPEDRWLRDESSVDRAIASALGPMALDLRDRGFPTAARPSWPFEWPVAP